MEKAQRSHRPDGGPRARATAQGGRRRRCARGAGAGRVRLGHQHRARAPTTTPTTAGANAPIVKTLGVGVTADHDQARRGARRLRRDQAVHRHDPHRAPSRSRSTSIYINDINAHGGIAGRKIVPVYKYYSPLGTAQIVPLCTSFAQDDKVFAVVGTFIDFSGDAQTCIAKQQQRVLMTFNLTQAIIDKSPPGLIVTAGHHPRAVRGDPARAARRSRARSRARPSRCSATRPRRPS